jgi:hypothetical protein
MANPLALSLLTDLYQLQPERFMVQHPDVIQTLVRRLLDDVPTPLHRRALEVCAHLRTTTEDRLAKALVIRRHLMTTTCWSRSFSDCRALRRQTSFGIGCVDNQARSRCFAMQPGKSSASSACSR